MGLLFFGHLRLKAAGVSRIAKPLSKCFVQKC